MTSVSTGGKRAGSRKGPKKRSLPSRVVLLLCLAVTVSVVAWGYLVYAAIDFGSAARGGEQNAWIYLGVACLGAAGCLFVGLMLSARILRQLGILASPQGPHEDWSATGGEEKSADEPDDKLAGATPTLTVSPVIEVVPTDRPTAGASPAPSAPTRPSGEGAVPSPRAGEPPRGKRIAEKGRSPDGPRQSGGRRIAR